MDPSSAREQRMGPPLQTASSVALPAHSHGPKDAEAVLALQSFHTVPAKPTGQACSRRRSSLRPCRFTSQAEDSFFALFQPNSTCMTLAPPCR